MNQALNEKLVAIKSALMEGGVEKVPVFSKFEVNLSLAALEKLVKRNHPNLKPGSCKFRKGVEGVVSGGRGQAYVNFDCESTDGKRLPGGSVIMAVENNGSSVRMYAYTNVE